METIKKHWFKIVVAAALIGMVLFLSIPSDKVSRKELIDLEIMLRQQAFDGQQFVIDSLEESIGKTNEKIVSLQKQFGETKKNLQYIETTMLYQFEQYKALKNEVEKINYSDSSVAAILQRISPND